MPKNNEIFLVLHNIRSAYNVGSIFRTADAAGVSKIYLCGYTPIPETRDKKPASQAKRGKQVTNKISKTALGAQNFVPWERHKQTWRLLEKLSARGGKDGFQIVALEQTKDSIDYRKFKPRFPLALILGNEITGLSKNILKYTSIKMAIPMYGRKESLNVAVAFGISVYEIIKLKR